MIKQLQKGKLPGEVLDVYDEETHIPEELLQLDNVVLTPHICTETIEASSRAQRA
ncbi:MAG: NAD(P)-dependent oxidoreductase [Pseudomonadota bacterium]